MTNKHVVVLVHGIRDFALWQNQIRDALERAGFIVEPTNYGRLNVLEFLVPIAFFRKKAIERIRRQLRIVRQKHSGAHLSVIAHSFGTYVIANILKTEFDLQLHRVVFCGSVVNYDFDFESVSGRFSGDILSEVGTKDPWPAIAESVTFGYGSAGTYGFRRPLVRDRWHNGAGHSFFLTAEFCNLYWVPYLREGSIVQASASPGHPPFWLRLLSIFKLKYALLAGLLALASTLAISRDCRFDSLSGDVSRLEAAIDANLVPFPNNALKDAESLIDMCPRSANAWRQMGRILYRLGRYDESLNAFSKGLELRPSADLESKLRIGKAAGLINQGLPDSMREAESLLVETLRRFPGQDLAWKNLAIVRMRLGKSAEAREIFSKQISLASTDAERSFALTGFGISAWNLGQREEAIASLDAAVCSRPDLRAFFLGGDRRYIDGWNFEAFSAPLKELATQAAFQEFLSKLRADGHCP